MPTNLSRIKAGLLGAVILAGGSSSRLSDKCFKTLAHKELIVHVFERLSEVTDEIVVAVKSSEHASHVARLLPAAVIVRDEVRDQTPLVGFLSGLRAIKTQYVFVAPCDAPFIQPEVIRFLFQRALGNDGAIAITTGQRLEPLCAIYDRDRAIVAAEQSVEHRYMSMLGMLEKLDTLVRVPVEEVRKVDPQFLTFRNINTAEDLAWAEQAIQK